MRQSNVDNSKKFKKNVKRMNILKRAGNKINLPFNTVKIRKKLISYNEFIILIYMN